MAKIMKDTRTTMDVDTELEKIKKSKEKEQTKLSPKKDNKKNKKKDDKNKKKNKVVSTKKPSFLKEVRNEVSKVKWPSKKDMIKYSVATISFIIFFSLFFYLIDLFMALLKEVF